MLRFGKHGTLKLFIAFLLLVTAPALAQNWTIQRVGHDMVQLPDVVAADRFAQQCVEENAQNPQEVVVLHIGEEIPKELTWILATLDTHRIRYSARLITPSELETALAQTQSALQYIMKEHAVEIGDGAQQLATALQPAPVPAWRRWLGLPYGFSVWFRFDRSLTPNSSDFGRAALDASVTAVSIYGATFTGDIVGDFWLPLAVITSWAGANTLMARYLNRFMSAGRATEVLGRAIKGRDNYPYSLTLSMARSLITNIVIASVLPLHWSDIIRASIAGPFARVAGDMYLRDHQPGLLGDGGSTERAQWSPTRWNLSYVGFNLFIGLVRAADVLGNAGGAVAHGAIAIAGAYMLMRRSFTSMRNYRKALRCELALNTAQAP